MSTDPRSTDRLLSRRALFAEVGGGLAGLALLSALGRAGLFAQGYAGAAGGARIPARAKRCIFLFMFGGPSQMDLFDYKPELQKRHGQTIELERRRGDVRESVLLGSKRTFRRYGETGQWVSDALPELARHVDKLAVIKSLYTDSFAHGSALLQMNSGQIFQGHPALGAWLDYGLGSDNASLPGFVVMHDPRGGPISGPANWSSGYMPARYQGTLLRSGAEPVLDLLPAETPTGRAGMTRAMQGRQVDLIQALDDLGLATRPNDSELTARRDNHRLAFEMQESALEALDLAREDPRTLAVYAIGEPKGEHALSVGPSPFGRQCLIARRLIERGVRFVQIYHGGGHQQQTWDAHHGVEENLGIHCPEVDRPISALLTDLERTGLLDETLVIWGGEFGRMPVSQQAGDFQIAHADGRDHNPKGFTMWLAGAGVKPGGYGETDELGREAVEERHHVRDLHATILHLMGLDHEKLTYPYGGLDRRLTGVIESHPIAGVMA
jgi:Protein of unknown function (DUF1501)